MEEQRVENPSPAGYLPVRETAKASRISGKLVVGEKGRLRTVQVEGRMAIQQEDMQRLGADGRSRKNLSFSSIPPAYRHLRLTPHGCADQSAGAPPLEHTSGGDMLADRHLLAGSFAQCVMGSEGTQGRLNSNWPGAGDPAG
jgi:hypothetical protein